MKRLSTEDFVKRARAIHGDRYSYVNSVYINANSKIFITCSKHGDFLQKPNDHTSDKNGCPKCKFEYIASIKRTPESEVISRFREIHKNNYDYSNVKYVNMKTKISINCHKHGEFLISPEHHLRGQGCRRCRASSGEAMVASVLTSLGIRYETEKTFPQLKSQKGNPLRFDFFLPGLNALIEFDGPQHTLLNSVFRNCCSDSDEILDRFIETRINDITKNKFAVDNCMYLIRIPHTANTLSKVRHDVELLIETAQCNPEYYDYSGKYVISSEKLL